MCILIMHIVAYFIVVFSSIVLVLIQVSEDRLLHLEHLLLMINAR